MINTTFEEETYRKAAEQVLKSANEIMPSGLTALMLGLIFLALASYFFYRENHSSLNNSYVGRFVVFLLLGIFFSFGGLVMVNEHAQAKKNPEYFVIRKLSH